ncbi:hypothetical protein [Bacillus sp. FJAT-45037]|uniref:hypothetical protein n=1 Tax=Bacillus sp. FJAT-45037 TaxID=2011007 RepID=UPI0012FE2C22|nr:hypothetical protein [Bacillus sp. FJAT-45037]
MINEYGNEEVVLRDEAFKRRKYPAKSVSIVSVKQVRESSVFSKIKVQSFAKKKSC